MSLKRKQNEYHDPDYLPIADELSPNKKKVKLDGTERLDKIREIIKREFQNELQQKELEIKQIDLKLEQAKRLLQRVRYSVVATYYSNRKLEYSEQEIRQKDFGSVANEPVEQPTTTTTTTAAFSSFLTGTKFGFAQQSSLSSSHQQLPPPLPPQNTIHPSLKRLLGKKPINYDEILSVRPARQAAQSARASITEKLVKVKKEDKKGKSNLLMTDTTVPADDPPMATPIKIGELTQYSNSVVQPVSFDQIPRITSSRGGNYFRHLIAVGNTSQYVGDDRTSNGVTHKWLIYIKTKNSDIQIETIVSKIRFFLHPSYQPHDVIEVNTAPFQLSRRGWGEFPVRVQLYFHTHVQQKPLQIIHNLVLDKRLTGLQTMGAETLVEIWINVPNNFVEDNNDANSSNDMKIKMDQKILMEKESNKMNGIKQEPKKDNNQSMNQSNVNKSKQLQQQSLIEKPQICNLASSTIAGSKITSPIIIASNTKAISTLKTSIPATKILPATVTTPATKMLPTTVTTPATKMLPTTVTIAPKMLAATVTHASKIMATTVTTPATKMLPTTVTTSVTKILPTTVTTSAATVKPKNLFKCIDSNGKLITVELSIDPSNNKNIKLIKVPTTTTATVTTPTALINPSAMKFNQSISNLPKILSSAARTTTTTTTTTPIQIVRPIIASPASGQLNQMISKTSQPFSAIQSKSPIINKIGSQKVIILQMKKPGDNSTNRPIVKTIMNRQITNANETIQSIGMNKSMLTPTNNHMTINSPAAAMATTTTLATATKSSNILLKNGQIFMVGASDKSKLKAKQESLLKPKPPQISLLKTKSNLNVPDYLLTLKRQFFNMPFTSTRIACQFLLKNVPLINPLQTEWEYYRKAFPFCIENVEKFHLLRLPARRCHEWYRGKFVNRLLHQHPTVKSYTEWTTKEIIQFGRQFGYTPQLCSLSATNGNNSLEQIHSNSSIKQEQIEIFTQSNRRKVDNWIELYLTLNPSNGFDQIAEVEEFIDIIDVDKSINLKHLNSRLINNMERIKDNCMWLKSNDKLQTECYWVSDICRSIKIELVPEEIVPGVMHMTAQRLIVQALQSFLEHLLRSAFGGQRNAEQFSNLPIERIVQNVDIQRVIANVTEFDFLSNKHLGISNELTHTNQS